jgi:hypothetical protein
LGAGLWRQNLKQVFDRLFKIEPFKFYFEIPSFKKLVIHEVVYKKT